MADRGRGASRPYRNRGGGNYGEGRSYKYSDDHDYDYYGYKDEYYDRRDYYDSKNPNPRGRGIGKRGKQKGRGKDRPNSSQSNRGREQEANDSDASTQSEPAIDKRADFYSKEKSSKPSEKKVITTTDSNPKQSQRDKNNPGKSDLPKEKQLDKSSTKDPQEWNPITNDIYSKNPIPNKDQKNEQISPNKPDTENNPPRKREPTPDDVTSAESTEGIRVPESITLGNNNKIPLPPSLSTKPAGSEFLTNITLQGDCTTSDDVAQRNSVSRQIANPGKEFVDSKELDFHRKMIEDQNLRIAKLEAEFLMKENEMSAVITLSKCRDEQFEILKQELTTLRENNLNLEFRLGENLHQKQILKEEIVEKENYYSHLKLELINKNSKLSQELSTVQNEHRLSVQTVEFLNESLQHKEALVHQLQSDLITSQNSCKDKLALTMSVEEMIEYINATSSEREEMAEENKVLTEANADLEEKHKNLQEQLNEVIEFQDHSSAHSLFATNALDVNLSGIQEGKALDNIITLQNRIWCMQQENKAKD